MFAKNSFLMQHATSELPYGYEPSPARRAVSTSALHHRLREMEPSTVPMWYTVPSGKRLYYESLPCPLDQR